MIALTDIVYLESLGHEMIIHMQNNDLHLL